MPKSPARGFLQTHAAEGVLFAMSCFTESLRLFFRSHQTSISMRRGAKLASAQFTLLSPFGPASGTTHGQSRVFFGAHIRIMRRCLSADWSIVTTLRVPFGETRLTKD